MNSRVSYVFLQYVGGILVTTACLVNVGQLSHARRSSAVRQEQERELTLILNVLFSLITLTSEALCLASPVTCCSNKN